MSKPSRNRAVLALWILAGVAAFLGGCKPQQAAPTGPAGGPGANANPHPNGPAGLVTPAGNGNRLSGPYVHDNLAIYLIHGPDKLKDANFLTLQEAMEQKKIVVSETGTVNELSVENVGDVAIYIHAGDIVRGGRQDRCVPNDWVLKPKSGQVAVASFCVEHGRWSQRADESAAVFNSSSNMITSNNAKIAARVKGDQSGVWSEVTNTQNKLGMNAGGSVQSGQSATSLELSLSNEKVKAAIEGYVKEMSVIVEKSTDVIGFAYAVNGKVYAADVYASAGLFRKLWPKLLKATATEALANLEKDKKFDAPPSQAIVTFMTGAEKPKATSKKIATDAMLDIYDSNDSVMLNVRATSQPDGRSVDLHSSFLKK